MFELRIFLVLAAMLLIPGWFALAFTGIWRRWSGLQSWILAIGLSIAFYPVFFYTARFLIPWLTFGPYKMSALLILMLILTLWLLRREGATFRKLDLLEWMALAAFGITIFTRYWIIRDQPYPAWSDSLHHTLLTELTAVQGQLPHTLDPYFPIPLDQYHLGLYALSATVQWIAQVPAHTALLWTAQMLNALCGIGVYLVLDRKVGRVGAIAGLVTAGLLLSQPALYVNWGRFTQLSSQVILLIGWLLVWEALTVWTKRQQPWRDVWGYTVLAAITTAAVFLLHFRVAAFYLPLIVLTTLWVLWSSRRERSAFTRSVMGLLAVGGLSLLLVLPVLVDAMRVYVTSRLAQGAIRVTTSTGSAMADYYTFPLSSFPYLIGVSDWWVLWAASAALLFGLIRRSKLVLLCLFWLLSLFGLGYAYLLGIRLLNLTNLGAVLIMIYLPIGLTVGVIASEILNMVQSRRVVAYALSILFLVGGVAAAPARATTIEAYRYFVTPADVAAMEWINANTEPDALFAVNTYFWLPGAPHGTDAGYWIPYFTGRSTTASVMIFSSLARRDYRTEVIAASQQVRQLETDPAAIAQLAELGVDYIFIGQIGNFASSGLKSEILRGQDRVEEVFSLKGVSIFHLKYP